MLKFCTCYETEWILNSAARMTLFQQRSLSLSILNEISVQISSFYSRGFSSGAWGGCLPRCYIDIIICEKNWLLSVILGRLGWLYMEMKKLIWQGCHAVRSFGGYPCWLQMATCIGLNEHELRQEFHHYISSCFCDIFRIFVIFFRFSSYFFPI